MNDIIKSLNLTDGTVLTLERLSDRLEFEAFSAVAGMEKGNNDDACSMDVCAIYVECLLKDPCPRFEINTCDCDGPHGYINCHPYRG